MKGSAQLHSNFYCPFFRRKHLTAIFAMGFVLTFTAGLSSCVSVKVYNEPYKPFFRSAENAVIPAEDTNSLSVLTFNIKKAEKVELAGSELEQFQKSRSVDIFLLQEMDESGVKLIAEKLGLNYLYIPVVYNNSYKKNVGNAILTKGTIDCPEKFLLPNAKPLSKSRRLATVAEVTLHQKKIMVYSVHTETAVMSRAKRMQQLSAVIEHAKAQMQNYKYVLIGGDLNTLFSKDAALAVEKFTGNGFDYSTAATGNTANELFGLIKPKHDYIFSKGLRLTTAFKIASSKSSDHYPVFATFRY